MQHYAGRHSTRQLAAARCASPSLSGTLAPGATAAWSVTLQPSQLPMTQFGVYPLAAQAENSDQSFPIANETFLPYWPGVKDQDPQRQQIAWIWPLIDQPRQGMCSGLLNNGLAASLAPGGRLAGCWPPAAPYAGSAHLTWAIDPALLANADDHDQAVPRRAGRRLPRLGRAGQPGRDRTGSPS